MDAYRMAALINTCHFKPGWTITAEAHPQGLPMVRTEIRLLVPNSNRDNALMGYPSTLTAKAEDYAYADQYATDDEVYEYVFKVVSAQELHEAREFFRVGASMRAPFHPHRPEGEAAWDTLVRREAESVGVTL